MAGIFIDALPPVVTPAMSDVFPMDQASTTFQVSNTQMLSLYQTNASGLWGINISGNAATATTAVTATTATNANNILATQVATNASFFPLFVASSVTGNQAVDLGTGLTFNPSTNNLSTTTFTGALAGNATTATTATNATNIAITNDNATNATMYPIWVTTTTGNLPAKVSSTQLTFNPSTGTLAPVSIAPSAQAVALNMNSHLINNVTNGVAAQDAVTVSQLTAASSPLTTKGDLYTFTTVNARLAVAVGDGKILQVSSGAATGLAYSTPTYPSASGSAGVLLRSDGTNNVYTTSTYPNTNAISTLLYASSANVMAALATANNGLLVTSSAGVPSILAGPGTTGNLLLSNAAAAPSFTTFTYPTTVGATGSIYISNGTNIVSSTSLWPNTAGTALHLLLSDGTSNVYSTPAYPNASVTSGKIIVSDGTNYIASTSIWPNTVGTALHLVLSDGTSNVYSTPAYPNASVTAGKTIISDGTNYVASTSIWPNTVGTSGKFVLSDGTSNVYSTSTIPTSAGAVANKFVISDGTNYVLSASTITLGGNFTTSGAFTTTLTMTANTNVTLPTSGTLLTSASINAYEAEGRLTLTSGTPVTTADVTAATTLYYALYKGDHISLFDGSATWTTLAFTELSIAVPGTTSQMYDVWVYNNSGTAALELLAWTNDTTRATALTTQNGIYVKTGVTTRRYVGSFRTTTVSGQTEDSVAKRYVWNYYNRSERPMTRIETTDSWTYSTTSFQQANAAAANQLDCVIGVSEDQVEALVFAKSSSSTATARNVTVGIGINSTTVSSATMFQNGNASTLPSVIVNAQWRGFLAVGRNTIVWLEKGGGTDTQTWFGDGGGTNLQSGISGFLLG